MIVSSVIFIISTSLCLSLCSLQTRQPGVPELQHKKKFSPLKFGTVCSEEMRESVIIKIFRHCYIYNGFQLDIIFTLTEKRRTGYVGNVETTNRKSSMSGKMWSVTEKACLICLPAGNIEQSLQIFKI